MEEHKLKSYFGFCRRAGKLVLGINAIGAVRGKVWLIVGDRSASVNARAEIEKLQRRFSCPLLWLEGLETLVNKSACKAAAVREEHLAAAIARAGGSEEE